MRAARAPWPAARRALVVVATGALAAAAAQGADGCRLSLRSWPDGAVLVAVPLPADRTFSIAYTHSVTRRRVQEDYVARGDRIWQTAEWFDDHGPGMATEALPGERFERVADAQGVRWRLAMQRVIGPGPLVLRAMRLPDPQLSAGGAALPLTRWGERPLEVRSDGCAAGEGG